MDKKGRAQICPNRVKRAQETKGKNKNRKRQKKDEERTLRTMPLPSSSAQGYKTFGP